jgi:hypothetical protein
VDEGQLRIRLSVAVVRLYYDIAIVFVSESRAIARERDERVVSS